jgi:polar amino acid transport system substrate-binding protein
VTSADAYKQGTYIAFSLQTDAHLIARWQQTLENMKGDGQLNRLKKRWLTDHTMP